MKGLCTTALAGSLAVTLFMSGCALQSPQAHWDQYYSLGTPPQIQVSAASAATARRTLRVGSVAAPAWLQSPNIYYRLLYHSGSRIAAYSRSRWVASVPSLVEQYVLASLTGATAWKAVIGPGDTAEADLLLRLHLLEFQQDFTSPNHSYAVLRLRATLVRTSDEQVLGEKLFRCSKPAPSADAEGGARALSQATGQCTSAIANWAAQTDGS